MTGWMSGLQQSIPRSSKVRFVPANLLFQARDRTSHYGRFQRLGSEDSA